MRVLLVSNGYPPAARGGVETYTQALAAGLAGRGHTVEVFCRVGDLRAPEYAVRVEGVAGVPVRRVVNDLTGAATFDAHYRNPRIEALFRQHAADFRPDVVHVQHALGLSAGLLPAVKQAGLPLVVTVHDFWYLCPRATLFDAARRVCAGPGAGVDCVRCLGGVRLGPLSFLQRWPAYKWLLARAPLPVNQGFRSRLDRPSAQPPAQAALQSQHQAQMAARTTQLLAWLQLADRLLTPSDFVRQRYAEYGLPADRLTVLPLGVEQPAAAGPRAGGPFTVAYFGTLQYHKGPDVLVEAFRLAAELPARLRIYGTGAPGEAYADDLRARAAGDARISVEPPFPRDRLAAVLAGVDVLAVPSRCYETYSLAAREALLAGVPVVATRMGALVEVVRDGVNGALIAPDDAPALAAALRRAPGEGETWRAGARTFAAPTPAEHVAAVAALYTTLRG
ncbi:MAG: glycosyltransferase family 4 protein [Anaerolineales bacterium]|nr:glycosyltransferase family 4 protein [Anaerolineales bacterium]